ASASTASSVPTAVFHSPASACAEASIASTTAASSSRGCSAALRAWMWPMRPAPMSATLCMLVSRSEFEDFAVLRGPCAGFGQGQCGDAVGVAGEGFGAAVHHLGEVRDLRAVGVAVALGERRHDRRAAAAGLGEHVYGVLRHVVGADHAGGAECLDALVVAIAAAPGVGDHAQPPAGGLQHA